MIWFRQYLSLLVPLIALLIGVESVLLINRAVVSHEEIIGKNYAIVFVSQNEIKEEDIKKSISNIHSIRLLDTSQILSDIDSKFNDTNIDDLKRTLPFFYAITLNSFPNQNQIKELESNLMSFDGVTRVESFSKTHDQTYRLLVLLKGCIFVLSGIIFIISLFLMIKQIEVWRFEHSERMEIMTYLGAHSKIKNAPLYRLALVDSLLAALIVVFIVAFIANTDKINSIVSMLGINIFSSTIFIIDYFVLLFVAYAISMISVFVVILFQKEP